MCTQHVLLRMLFNHHRYCSTVKSIELKFHLYIHIIRPMCNCICRAIWMVERWLVHICRQIPQHLSIFNERKCNSSIGKWMRFKLYICRPQTATLITQTHTCTCEKCQCESSIRKHIVSSEHVFSMTGTNTKSIFLSALSIPLTHKQTHQHMIYYI